MVKLTVVFLSLLAVYPSLAERVFDELAFTAETCQRLGYAHDFDECSIMEFCHSPDDRQLDDLEATNENDQLPKFRLNGLGSSNVADQTFVKEVQEAETEQSHREHPDNSQNQAGFAVTAPNRAKYGWRVVGSTTCSWPGPIMRLKRGVNHGLFIKGSAKEPTNVHFHGLHIAGHGNGDNMYRYVAGNENTLIYGIHLPVDAHMGGTHWYHSHMMGKSWNQVSGGAFGMIVVDDNGYDVGSTDKNVLGFLANEKVFILDNTNDGWKVNGLLREEYHFVKDEWYRMRILAVNVNSHSDQENIEFGSGCQVHPIAHDGIFRFEVPAPQIFSATLTSSSRLDVAIRCSTDSTVVLEGVKIATIHVDSSKPPLPVTPFDSGNTWRSRRLEYTKDLSGVKPDHSWRVELYETSINDIGASQHKPLCDSNGEDFKYGTVVSVELHGADTHPFHMHMYPMQVASKGCGTGHEVGEFYDTIVTDGSDMNIPCILRFHLIDIAGPTTVHCHIFEHTEQGSLGWFNVYGGPVQTGPTCMKGSQCGGDSTDPLPRCNTQRRLRPVDKISVSRALE